MQPMEIKDDRGPLDLTLQIEELQSRIKNMNWLKNHDYEWLIQENKKLDKEVKELKIDNKKLSEQIQDKNDVVQKLRDKGVI